ncbi:MAG: DUF1207 domain-containing protein [Bacteroidales bacterium]|nr:DUF1207 domain-containing protein [Bacteroidales bacterium]
MSQKADFLPKQNLWHTQSLDPIAAQSFIRMNAVWENNSPADYVLPVFAFGFQKSAVAWQFSEDISFDIGIEGSAFTQFEWTRRNGEFERNILSTDFLIGIPLVLTVESWTIRLRIYHLSSHLGDDFIIKNKITSYVKTNNNYEQVDLTASYLMKNFRFYFGGGVVIRATRDRKPLVFTGGMDYLLSLNQQKSVHLFAGLYLDARQEFDYSPASNLGIGVQFGKTDRRPVKLLATYFRGPLPYSVFHGKPVQWLGISLYINPF